jgi:hypothetical protein
MIAEQTALQTRTHSALTPATVAGVSEGVELLNQQAGEASFRRLPGRL